MNIQHASLDQVEAETKNKFGIALSEVRGDLNIMVQEVVEDLKASKTVPDANELFQSMYVVDTGDGKHDLFLIFADIFEDSKDDIDELKGDISDWCKRFGDAMTTEEYFKNSNESESIGKKFVCIEPGLIEVLKGEARSADVKDGDVFVVERETPNFYEGQLEIKGSFSHQSGLSGKKTDPTPFKAQDKDIIFGLRKKNIDGQLYGIGGGPMKGFAQFKEEKTNEMDTNEANTFNVKKRKIMDFKEFSKHGTLDKDNHAPEKGEHEIVKAAMGHREGKKGFGTLEN